jgi:hypothetical protein
MAHRCRRRNRMTQYEARLATRITADARKRLRLAAAVADKSISATLTDVLVRALPTADELLRAKAAEEEGTDADSE